MANEPELSKDGVFVDSKTGKVVKKAPEEGVQLVPAGGVIDDHAKRAIEAHEALETASADDDVETADDKTVKTTSVKKS